MRKEEAKKGLRALQTSDERIDFLNGKKIDLRRDSSYLSMINNGAPSGEYRGLIFGGKICTPWERYPGFHHETAFIFDASTKILVRKNKGGTHPFVMTVKNEGAENSIFKFKTAKDRKIFVVFLRTVLN